MRLYAVAQVRDEARMLPGMLAHLRPYVDGFVVVDDGSTDGTTQLLEDEEGCDVLRRAPDRLGWDERLNRQWALSAARCRGADWVIACDADERYSLRALECLREMIAAAEDRGAKRVDLECYDAWDRPDHIRVDRYGWKRVVYKLPDTGRPKRRFHGPWIEIDGPSMEAPLGCAVYHLGSLTREMRAARRARWEQLDPEHEWSPRGYEHITDETGLETLRLMPGTYDYDSLPDDVRALMEV